MKPPRFDYEAPRDLDTALGLLAERGADGKVLAGGQSLVPLLNFRLARPDVLIDVNEVQELSYLRREAGTLHIGALTRQAQAERSPIVQARWPLLGAALRFVAHPQIRNRGTIGGSVAHADPAAELPVALTALDARYHVRSTRGARTIAHDAMFHSQLETDLGDDELLCEVEVPALPAGAGCAFEEYARRNGDFALGGAAVVLVPDAAGHCSHAAIALLGAATTPVRASAAEALLVGRRVDEPTAREAAAEAVRGIAPTGDIHGSSGYRRDLIETLVRRAVVAAAGRMGDAA